MKCFAALFTLVLSSLVSQSAEPATTADAVTESNSRARHIAELLSGIPPELRIVIPAVGDTLAYLVVFVDTDCVFCSQLHGMRNVITRRGIEIDYLFYPRSGPYTDSYDQAVAVWCSADRLSALEYAFRGGRLDAASCDNPVLAHYELARKLDLKGTPAIITPDGVIAYGVPGHDRPTNASQQASASAIVRPK